MKFRKVVSQPIVVDKEGVAVAGGWQAVVAGSVGEKGPVRTSVSSHQRIVQRNGKTEVFEQDTDTTEPTHEGPTQKEES